MLMTASGEEVKIKHFHLETEFRSAKDNDGKDLTVVRTQIIISTAHSCRWFISILRLQEECCKK